MEALELYGADLRLVPAAAYTSPNHYIHTAKKIAEEQNAFWAQQFDNLANRDIHRDTTGTEIWEQTNGNVDGFVCAVGTGGTLAGVSAALKAKNPNVKIAVADPDGSALHSHYTNGALQTEGKSITEGIGISFLTKNLEGAEVDNAYKISDAEALPYIYSMLAQEGLCLGGSSGINIAGAVRLAKELGPGHTIVTILCDHGERYRQKIFNPVFLAQHDLPCPPWMESWTN
jgi:cysteine synthase A